MIVKILKIIAFLSLVCFLYILCVTYWLNVRFQISLTKAIFQKELDLLIFFGLLGYTAFKKQKNLMFITLILGLLWSYFADPIWLGKWVLLGIKDIVKLNSTKSIFFFSDIAALSFFFIILLNGFLLFHQIYLFFKTQRWR